MVWSQSEDSRQWPRSSASPKKGKRVKKTAARRHLVLGKWREIKQQMYHEYMLSSFPSPEQIEEHQWRIQQLDTPF